MVRSAKNELPGELLTRAFFEAPPQRVARHLLGKILVRRTNERKLVAGRIVEVEAYLGPHQHPPDPAAHSHRGPTPRNQVLFGPPGHAYVYFIYGMHSCMNVSCEGVGLGGGVLIRALEPVIGLEQMARNRGLAPGVAPCELTSGPGRLCDAMGITRSADNGLDLVDPKSPLQMRDDGTRPGRVLVTVRIGIRHAASLPLRFLIAGNACVSGPKSLNRPRIFPRPHSVTQLKPIHLLKSAQKP